MVRRIRLASVPETGEYTWYNVLQRLRSVGLRPTRQRVSLAFLLFRKGPRHVTAELIHEEAINAKLPMSLATVYNALRQFTCAGLLREIAADGPKKYFDNNTSEHHHFLLEDTNNLLDVSANEFSIGEMPTPPEGYEIARVEVVFRLRRRQE